MKSVLISIRPKWCALIASGQKTVEIRKTRPKIKTPFKCYIYETKAKNGAGKVIGEFTCDYILTFIQDDYYCPAYDISDDDLNDSRLHQMDLYDYGQGKTLYGWHVSDLKIYDKPRKLSEFQKPCIDPYQFCQCCEHGIFEYPEGVEVYQDLTERYLETTCSNRVTRPPQSWRYVEELEK